MLDTLMLWNARSLDFICLNRNEITTKVLINQTCSKIPVDPAIWPQLLFFIIIIYLFI